MLPTTMAITAGILRKLFTTSSGSGNATSVATIGTSQTRIGSAIGTGVIAMITTVIVTATEIGDKRPATSRLYVR
jgi:hypothetical protein